MQGIPLAAADMAFLAEALPAFPGLSDPGARTRLSLDGEFRAMVLGDDRLPAALLQPGDAIAPVTPALLFEVLLRRSLADLSVATHTMERDGGSRIPVFDAPQVTRIAAEPDVVTYVVGLLASFTRVRSYTQRVWVRRGIVHKVRYSDMDVNSLLRLLRDAEEPERPALHRRVADTCLFILGMFPDFPATATRYPGSGRLRPRGQRLSTEEYETLGAQMYAATASDATRASDAQSAAVLSLIGDHIAEVKKPVSFMAEHYLGFRRQRLFGAV